MSCSRPGDQKIFIAHNLPNSRHFMDKPDFRQALLRYFSEWELTVIRSITVGVAGLGGLGFNCALNLVRCGFERFVVADFDRVEAR
jgi:tRNA A37 threonylcarbamoyladenosine dehydratase